MATFDELNLHNHELTELSNVLLYLLQDRSMCDTATACDLLCKFMGTFNKHMGLVGHLYQGLLADELEKANNTARLFMSGEQELKRIIAQYARKWCVNCRSGLMVADHEQFMQETKALFSMVLSRVKDETEHLYPLVREIRGETRTAA